MNTWWYSCSTSCLINQLVLECARDIMWFLMLQLYWKFLLSKVLARENWKKLMNILCKCFVYQLCKHSYYNSKLVLKRASCKCWSVIVKVKWWADHAHLYIDTWHHQTMLSSSAAILRYKCSAVKLRCASFCGMNIQVTYLKWLSAWLLDARRGLEMTRTWNSSEYQQYAL